MAATRQCPKCGSGRVWNVRPLQFVLAVALLLLGADRLFDCVTEGLNWRPALSGFALVGLAVIIGLIAAQNPPRYCVACKGRF